MITGYLKFTSYIYLPHVLLWGGPTVQGFCNDTSVLLFLKKRFCFMSLSATPFPLFTFAQTVRINLIWHLINNRPCFPQIFLQPNPIILGVWSLLCLPSEHCAIKTQRKSCSDSMANQIWICISDVRFHTNTHRWGVGGVGISRHHIGCTVIAESGSD